MYMRIQRLQYSRKRTDEHEGRSKWGNGDPDEAAVPMSRGAFLEQGAQVR